MCSSYPGRRVRRRTPKISEPGPPTSLSMLSGLLRPLVAPRASRAALEPSGERASFDMGGGGLTDLPPHSVNRDRRHPPRRVRRRALELGRRQSSAIRNQTWSPSGFAAVRSIDVGSPPGRRRPSRTARPASSPSWFVLPRRTVTEDAVAVGRVGDVGPSAASLHDRAWRRRARPGPSAAVPGGGPRLPSSRPATRRAGAAAVALERDRLSSSGMRRSEVSSARYAARVASCSPRPSSQASRRRSAPGQTRRPPPKPVHSCGSDLTPGDDAGLFPDRPDVSARPPPSSQRSVLASSDRARFKSVLRWILLRPLTEEVVDVFVDALGVVVSADVLRPFALPNLQGIHVERLLPVELADSS